MLDGIAVGANRKVGPMLLGRAGRQDGNSPAFGARVELGASQLVEEDAVWHSMSFEQGANRGRDCIRGQAAREKGGKAARWNGTEAERQQSGSITEPCVFEPRQHSTLSP